MAFNIFEGARRISKIVAAIWIIGWIVGAYYTYESVKPTVNVTYKITGFKETPIRIMEECSPDSIMNYVDMKTKSGTKVLVKLCREKPRISELMALAKNLEEEGDIKLAGRALDKIYNLFISKKPNSTEIAQLEAALAKADANGDTDEAWIDNQGKSLVQKQIGREAMVAIGSILFLWVFTWAIGWIVRGFMGIPKGQDNKE
jgi:hypothetical protein